MILSTKGRYAVMAMAALGVQGTQQPMTLASIARQQEIPLPYLEQIFVRLKRAGLVTAQRGPGGGYRLSRPAAEITISEIMAASDEPVTMTRCSSHRHEGCMAPRTRCLTHDLWEGLGAQIGHYLGLITLEDVCARRVQQKFPRAHAAPGMRMGLASAAP